MKGCTESVLVEGFSKRQNGSVGRVENAEWTGRTSSNKIVNFIQNEIYKDNKPVMMGDKVEVLIEKALPHSLRGRVVKTHSGYSPLKGDASYAA
jgi:hypothetical protein